MDIYDKLNYANAIYSGIIIFVGTCSNLACIFVCLRPNLRKTPTFIFYSFLLSSDIFTLYIWNTDHILIVFANIQLEYMGISLCKLVTFIQLCSMQFSAWILVLMTFERYLCVKITKWRLEYFNSSRAVVICLATLLFIGLINSSFAVSLRYVNIFKSNNSLECYGEAVYSYWIQEHVFVYSVLPAIIITILNLLLICKLRNTQKIRNDSGSLKSNISIMMTSTLFTLLTFPNSIAYGYFSNELFSTKQGTTLLFYLDSLAFSFHAWNFIGLYITNKAFKRELNSIFRLKVLSKGCTTISVTHE